MSEEPATETDAPGGRLARIGHRLAAFLDRHLHHTEVFPRRTAEEWRDLRRHVRDEAVLSPSYLLMCGLSAGIAALGLLQSSTAVVIGAMLISPLMSPIAALGFGFASLDGKQIRESAKVVAWGAAIGIITGLLLTLLSPIHNATPEIIARTEPTLLDLAIAVISGMAGAYATVQQRGGAAIGVAIATALMPPLATVGYGLGVGNLGFAAGAFLLFLTNLAAIGFAFAVVARVSGAARPITHVDFKPGQIAAGIAAFLVLAAPLALTLRRVTLEVRAQADVRAALMQRLEIRQVNIAQLQVTWPLRGTPSVDAVVVEPTYHEGAEVQLADDLERRWGVKPVINLQQVVAADVAARTSAIVDAAAQRTAAGIARDTPPLTAIRTALGLPLQGLWVNRAARSVQLVPFAIPGWTLGDYRRAEAAAGTAGGDWQVRVVPPISNQLRLTVETDDSGKPVLPGLDDANWALSRWGVRPQRIAGYRGRNQSEADRTAALAAATLAANALADGDAMKPVLANAGEDRLPATGSAVLIDMLPPPPPLAAEPSAPTTAASPSASP
ncbi:DUF389 domain-containing protein [Sandarakinorhabdus rubra]|uniref:DUF389 domain-containing protein n=1 Tax=Sandarakinorhabdus rubra TaxID=2672568 RepID=UPI0013D91178|nr:DUF389 domain-containing protein [Sandarakinorhabdus rubra]